MTTKVWFLWLLWIFLGGFHLTAAYSIQARSRHEITHIKWAFAAPIAPAESGSISFVATLK